MSRRLFVPEKPYISSVLYFDNKINQYRHQPFIQLASNTHEATGKILRYFEIVGHTRISISPPKLMLSDLLALNDDNTAE